MKQWLAQILGKKGERVAVNYLKNAGYQILAQDWRCELGQLDIVALDTPYVVIVEVKTRRNKSYGAAREMVIVDKQKRLTRLALQFLKNHQLLNHPVRFDVIAIQWSSEKSDPHVEHILHAFTAKTHHGMFS